MKDIYSILKDKNILIVEDDKVSSLFFQELFSSKVFSLYSVASGEEAVETLRGKPDIHLVLLDIRLPGMNGLETAPLLKAINPNIVIIAQTAYAHDNDKYNALLAGCDDYMTKPIRAGELFNIIMKYF